MRLPAVAGVLLLAVGSGLLAPPLLDLSGATAGAAAADAAGEARRLIAEDDGPQPGRRDIGWDPGTPAVTLLSPTANGSAC